MSSLKKEEPPLCKKCFDFYGNPKMQNLCSSCFADENRKPLLKPPQQDIELKNVPEIINKSFLKRKSIDSDNKLSNCNKKTKNDSNDSQKFDKINDNDASNLKSTATNTTKFEENKREKRKKPKRCSTCKKKIGVFGGFPCICENVFCGEHRYPFAHKCSVDVKILHSNLLESSNPKLINRKVEKI